MSCYPRMAEAQGGRELSGALPPFLPLLPPAPPHPPPPHPRQQGGLNQVTAHRGGRACPQVAESWGGDQEDTSERIVISDGSSLMPNVTASGGSGGEEKV